MTTEQMRKAGSLVKKTNLTNAELMSTIEALNLTLAFVEGMGPEWKLARTPLIYDLDSLKGFALTRGLIKCP